MRSLAGLFLAQSLVAALPSAHTRVANSDLLVDTNLFKVQGKLADNTTTVRFFGGIPYAEPPVGTARFRPPVTKEPEADVVDATKFGPSCIQLDTGTETVYTEYLPGFLLTPGQTQSEDCLSLNIWAPRALNASSELLPVMIWIHGGGFTGGGSASPYKYGTNIVRDHQDVIVVALNYRVTIFGFPNAAALNGEHLNPGLEDQRKAVEWVSENIRAFGGDPDRMILFGQSAGGMSVDKYAYAYPTDPLVSGLIAQSGLADSGLTKIDAAGTNFTYVAEQIGCSTTTASDDEVLACMQQADAADIIAVLNTYNATANGGRALSFTPAADGLTNFADYEERQEQGLFAHVPTLIAQVDNEGATLVSLPEGDAAPNQSAVDAITRNLATCPGARGAVARVKAGVPVWRARYFGEWPNLNPLEWLGAYHSSDIPMVFGTSDLLGSNTALEKQTSEYMQGAWVAFAKDPENGLKDQYAWPTYEAETESLVQLGYEGNAGAVFVKGDAFDESC